MDGYIFGGYTTQSWREYGGNYRTDNNAWLYWLKTRSGLPEGRSKVKMDGNQGHAIYPYHSYGPTFGGNHDIYVEHDMHNGYINWGGSYPTPNGYDSTFVTGQGYGNHHRMCDEIETYQVV